MTGLYRSLLLLFAGSSHKDLARQIRYLKEENEILRGKLPAKITVTRPQRERLLKFGTPLGASLKRLISIVHPDTFLRCSATGSGPAARYRFAGAAGRARPNNSAS